jgi:hypothetical protein
LGESSIPLLVIDRSERQKISKDIVELNKAINQLDLIDMYIVLHPTTAEYTFFSSSHGPFTKKRPHSESRNNLPPKILK